MKMSLFFAIAGAAAICSINFDALHENHSMRNEIFSMNTKQDTVPASGSDTWWKKEATKVNTTLDENDIKKARLRND